MDTQPLEPEPISRRHDPTFVVYIDESGDEGFRFGAGSSEWFVLSAVITRRAQDRETVKLVDQVRTLLGRTDKNPLHFRKLKHERRLPYVEEIAKANLRCVSVFVHKPSLQEQETFREGYRLYFYCARFLLERVSWYCRDRKTMHDAGDGSAEIIFSNRSAMPYAELLSYLKLLKVRSWYAPARIDWNAIKTDQIKAYSAGTRMGLVIADAVAGSFWYAVEPSRLGFTENRYARMLKPVVYRHGKYQGYGLKFWPREVKTLLETEGRFEWLRTEYQ